MNATPDPPEHCLDRALGPAQLSLIALGGAIGTGLLLGSGFAIQLAGPAVLVSYAIGALIALLFMAALAEMTIAHPLPGSFGALAEVYLGRFPGFLVRTSYLLGVMMAVGAEVSAIAEYMGYWWPQVPGLWWVLAFSAAIIGCNALDVRLFGTLESGFSLIKVAAIVVFILLGTWLVFGSAGGVDAARANYSASGGFAPNGVWGIWLGLMAAMFGFFGIEVVAVAAGEAKDPAHAIGRAFKATFARLAIFYLAAVALMLALVPWPEAGKGGSPFVIVMGATGIPYAAGTVNFIVLTAALSAMNALLYVSSRMLFSLAEAGQAPALFARVTHRHVPLPALLGASLGIALAAIVVAIDPAEAFPTLLAISTFTTLFAWGMVFVTHLSFRRRHGAPVGFKMWGYPWTSLAGAALIAALMLTMPLAEAFRLTLPAGLALLVLLALGYRLIRR